MAYLPPSGRPETLATRRALEDSIQELSRVPQGQAVQNVAAFDKFRRGVTHASSGRGATPEEFLAGLEPKGVALAFLLELYENKKMLRKQVAAVLGNLLQVSAWRKALRREEALCAQLPGDLKELLEVEEVEEVPERLAHAPELGSGPPAAVLAAEHSSSPLPATSSPLPAAGGTAARGAPGKPPGVAAAPFNAATGGEPTEEEVIAAIAAAKARIGCNSIRGMGTGSEPVAALHAGSDAIKGLVSVGLRHLEEGKQQMQALEYSAEARDEAAVAFESLRKGINLIVRSPSKEDDEVLDGLEPKDKILEFLVAFYERSRKHRARVGVALSQLLDFDSWAAVADADPSVCAAVRDLAVDREAPPVVPTATLSKIQAKCGSVNLRAQAADAGRHGNQGAVLVRIIGAHGITAEEGFGDVYVRVTVAGRVKRTQVKRDASSPRWDAEPFVFHVPIGCTSVQVAIIDEDPAAKEEALGTIDLRLADACTEASQEPLRVPIAGPPRGELELEFVYVAATRENPADAATQEEASAAAPRPAAAAAAARPAAAAADAAGGIFGFAPPGRSVRAPVATLVPQAGPPGSQRPSMPPQPPQARDRAVPPTPWGEPPALRPKDTEAAPVAEAAPRPPGSNPFLSEASGPSTVRGWPAVPVDRPSAQARPASRVAWVSLDPRTGDIKFYPEKVARLLERHWQQGAPKADLGDLFFGATVQFKPQVKQMTAKGSRDVRRVELASGEGEVVLSVTNDTKGHDWRISDDTRGGKEKRQPVPRDVTISA